MAVHFFFEHQNISLANRRRLKRFIADIFKNEGKNLSSLNYIFCSDKYLLKINQDYLKHNYYTDIITFNLSNSGTPLDGEVYISTDRVRDNAVKRSVTIREELHRVLFHGVLHLCGYEDKSKAEKKIMRRKEDYYLGKYFA